MHRVRDVKLNEVFGIRGVGAALGDVRALARGLATGQRFGFALDSAGLLRPDLAIPAYRGWVSRERLAPIYNLFDRAGEGARYRARTTRTTCQDFRGGRLSYDEHDGVDFVCPVGTPVVSAAPGILIAARDTWLRGGLTAFVDHGEGLVTSYSHLARLDVPLGTHLPRGARFATSGASGADIFLGFPWIPPHVHFMAWVGGRPRDPYAREGEPGLWANRNDPKPVGAAELDGQLDSDALWRSRLASGHDFDAASIRSAIERCVDPACVLELGRAPNDAARGVLLEDMLHHHPELFALDGGDTLQLRREHVTEPGAALTLPFPGSAYRGARFADSPWTRPPSFSPPNGARAW